MENKWTLILLLLAALAGAGISAIATDTRWGQVSAGRAQGASRMDLNQMRPGDMGGTMHGNDATPASSRHGSGMIRGRMMQGAMMQGGMTQGGMVQMMGETDSSSEDRIMNSRRSAR